MQILSNDMKKTFFYEDLNWDDEGWWKTNNEDNDEGNDDGDGYVVKDEVQLWGPNEFCKEKAANNGTDGLDANFFD